MAVLNNFLEAMGNTRIVRLKEEGRGPQAEVFVKLEGLNPGGSHKSRIAVEMIAEAEKQGVLRRGSGQTIVEPTGGNTGIGLAMASAIWGYRAKLIVPDNFSLEKQKVLRALGAEVILSDSSKGQDSHVELLWEMLAADSGLVFLDQFSNPANVAAHRKYSAQEILRSMDSIDYFVCGIGTGGSITGIGEVLKERYPKIKVIGVQPEGCDILNNNFSPHEIQGIAVGVLPSILNVDIIDEMVTVSFEDTLRTVRELARSDGLFLGLSSGAYIHAARQVALRAGSGRKILTLSPDMGNSYLEYFD